MAHARVWVLVFLLASVAAAVAQPAAESAVPATDSAVPATESAVPATDSAAPATDSAAPATDSAAPATDSAAPATDSAAPATAAAALRATQAAAPEHIVFGFAALTADQLDASHSYLSRSLPLLWFEALRGLAERDIDAAERAAFLGEARAVALRALEADYRGRTTQRDQMLFTPGTAAERAARYATLTDELSTIGRQIAAHRAAEPLVGPEPQRLPLVHWANHDGGELVSITPTGSRSRILDNDLAAAAEANGVDLLVYGLVESVEEYLFVEFGVYHRRLRRRVYEDFFSALPEDLYRWAPQFAGSLATVILGRPWAALRVVTDAATTQVVIDERVVGYGTVEQPYLRPGAVTVQTRAVDRPPQRRVVNLPANITTTLDVTAAAGSDAAAMVITSEPPGASVYIESQWRGRTPLTIASPLSPVYTRLSLDGYADRRVLLYPQPAGAADRNAAGERAGSAAAGLPTAVQHLVLSTDLTDWGTVVRDRQDVFYDALGAFVLSVPLPLFASAIMSNVLGVLADVPTAGSSLNAAAATDLRALGNAMFWTRTGGLVLSGSLLVNVGVRLFEYIDAAERVSGRVDPARD